MDRITYSSEEIDVLFSELGTLIETYEVDPTYGEHAIWDSNGFLHVIPMGEPGRLFALSLGKDVDSILPNLMMKAWELGADTITIFYLGRWNFSGDQQKLQKRVQEIRGSSNPGLLVQLRDINKAWQIYPVLLHDDGVLARSVRENTAHELAAELSNLETGEADPHESLVCKILNFVLPECLIFLREQARSLDESVRRDLIYSIRHNSELKHYISNASMTSNNLLVEAKNCKKNEGAHVKQLADYLGTAKIASVGILVTRLPLSHKLRKIIVDDRRENHGRTLILPMCDEDLQHMLRNAKLARYGLNEQMLIELAQQVLFDTH